MGNEVVAGQPAQKQGSQMLNQMAGDAIQSAGGNLSGHDPSVDVYMVPDFMGRSGQPDNQSTDRTKGSV